ncbi:hypothetical protein FHS40_007149 [Streptomyces spectabilis]|uniref:Uncharacterized protein n=1 Tax=Streptomyces spectabilis TaxID=68270 RepID=A0A7W8EY59_STRST|nr:hypothetical protein [Streptomyces spectabilis]
MTVADNHLTVADNNLEPPAHRTAHPGPDHEG